MPPLDSRQGSPDAAQPSPELTPDQVVARLLEAFAQGADSGASLLWAFGSPRLRSSSGDPHHLSRILDNELFAPLVDHLEADVEPLSRLEGAARQVVTVLSRDQGRVPYLFALSLARSGDREGCWLVSGLERAG